MCGCHTSCCCRPSARRLRYAAVNNILLSGVLVAMRCRRVEDGRTSPPTPDHECVSYSQLILTTRSHDVEALWYDCQSNSRDFRAHSCTGPEPESSNPKQEHHCGHWHTSSPTVTWDSLLQVSCSLGLYKQMTATWWRSKGSVYKMSVQAANACHVLSIQMAILWL